MSARLRARTTARSCACAAAPRRPTLRCQVREERCDPSFCSPPPALRSLLLRVARGLTGEVGCVCPADYKLEMADYHKMQAVSLLRGRTSMSRGTRRVAVALRGWLPCALGRMMGRHTLPPPPPPTPRSRPCRPRRRCCTATATSPQSATPPLSSSAGSRPAARHSPSSARPPQPARAQASRDWGLPACLAWPGLLPGGSTLPGFGGLSPPPLGGACALC